jgi:hypothetical protein
VGAFFGAPRPTLQVFHQLASYERMRMDPIIVHSCKSNASIHNDGITDQPPKCSEEKRINMILRSIVGFAS